MKRKILTCFYLLAVSIHCWGQSTIIKKDFSAEELAVIHGSDEEKERLIMEESETVPEICIMQLKKFQKLQEDEEDEFALIQLRDFKELFEYFHSESILASILERFPDININDGIFLYSHFNTITGLEDSTLIRNQSHTQSNTELSQRFLCKNFYPTADDLLVGTYVEAIEPEVRDAVICLNKKGIPTNSSGFYGRGKNSTIELKAILDDEAIEKLNSSSLVTAYESKFCIYEDCNGHAFSLELDNDSTREEIKTFWDQLVKLIDSSDLAFINHGFASVAKNEFTDCSLWKK